GPGPGSFRAWVGGLSTAGVVGLGLVLGCVVSVLLVLALSRRAAAPRPATAPRAASPAARPAAPGTAAPVGLAAVLNGMRRTATMGAGGAPRWRGTGLPDPRLIEAIDAVVAELRLATGEAAVGLPVRFGEVPPWADRGPSYGRRLDRLDRALYVWSVPF